MLDRVDPPLRAGESESLLAYLDYHRATFRNRVDGVDAAGLACTVGVSTMTLGGMMKHLTLVEDQWFTVVLRGLAPSPPWDTVDWDDDPDWEWRTGAREPAAELFATYDETVARSNRIITAALSANGVHTLSMRESRHDGQGHYSLRWILLHMIEEYARHNGHADLLRETIDGTVGE